MPANTGFDFKKIEEKVLKFWEANRIFEKSLEQRNRKKRFVFFEGPPTANGKPGAHHMLARSFKDLYGRYKTMQGFYVLRKAGWDTHGLPVEIEVEKELGFKNKKQIEEYGIAKFNQKAKESVWKYKKEWEEMTRRMGYWLDLEHPYITYEPSYMESLWVILKEIWNKKLLYQAHRVVPFCTRCGTPLSSHEVAQGYKKVVDRSVYVKFKLADSKFGQDVSILAWTTTPWTLPGNLALAVGKDIVYVLVKHKKEKFILAKDLVEKVIEQPYEIEKEISGADLVGLSYQPLFNIPQLQSEKSYHVYKADFVSTIEGTGVVHTAVMYGEDDYNLGTQLDLPKIHTVDEAGKFMGVNEELNGRYVKDQETEEIILKYLESNGNLFKTEDHEHDYPFCWRCDTPLLYYAKNSWFIKMSAVNKDLLANNQQINWIPEYLKEGRFGQWLSEGKDWAISRERYWGTPLPIWRCVKCNEIKMIGSVGELESQAVSSGNIFYLLRHGLTDRGELNERITSSRIEQDNYALTPDGMKQVEKNLSNLKKVEDIDLIFSSPFLRTKQTAEIAGKIFHQDVQFDDRLSEIAHALECEGKPHEACAIKHDISFDQPHGDGESWNDVRRRTMDFMSEINQKHKNKKILIVGHGDPLWLLEKMSRGKTASEIIQEEKDKEEWYPAPGTLKKVVWMPVPRNLLGELDLHRPFIDEVELRCESCKANMRRIPDLIDAWFDSGAMPYAQWHWPFENEKIFKEQFPADFIVEGIDQTRGWFYTLLAISTLLSKGPAYRNVMSLGHILDKEGKKMSKSKGNVVLPNELMDAVGVDAARWYFYSINAPGDPTLFDLKDVEFRLKGFLSTLQNCLRFYELYHSEAIGDEQPATNLLDAWILSRLNRLITVVTDCLDRFDPTNAARAIEKFVVEDFSNWWLRRSRKRKNALSLLRLVLLEIAKLTAPFIPYTAEDMHMRLHVQGAPGTLSVHLHDWPKAQKRAINVKLEEKMVRVQKIVTAGLAWRKEKQIKVRQPLQAVTVTGNKLESDLEILVKDEVNVKEVIYKQTEGDIMLDAELNTALIHEGYARELMRQIQDMRKEAGYRFDEKVYAQWHTDDTDLMQAIEQWSGEIQKDAVLAEFVKSQHDKKTYDVEKEADLVPGKHIWIGIRK
ncbi:MAG TPA: class I tRNA ligase family protein [Candidatus Paceibacterota bacterium]|nr:class I tRNA ligase family protein [Candidatus Paceibacterota bacterium]